MQRATSLELYRYWNIVRGQRPAPKRFEIEPSDISDLLPETLILETQHDSDYRYRLAGTRICELFGREFRGSGFLDQWDEPDRTTLFRRLRLIKERGAVLCFEFEIKSAHGHTAILECLMLPLQHGSRRVERFLGCMGPIADAPWIGEHEIVARKLGSFEILWPDTIDAQTVDHTSSNLPQDAMMPLPIRTARIVRDKRRQFRVYDGGLATSPSDDR
ncbi:MAG: PAS domain-containing protein [Pseudomonadota bacterium]